MEEKNHLKVDSCLEQTNEIDRLLEKGFKALASAEMAFKQASLLNKELCKHMKQEKAKMERNKAKAIVEEEMAKAQRKAEAERMAREQRWHNDDTADEAVEYESPEEQKTYQSNPRLQHIFGKK